MRFVLLNNVCISRSNIIVKLTGVYRYNSTTHNRCRNNQGNQGFDLLLFSKIKGDVTQINNLAICWLRNFMLYDISTEVHV